MAANIIVGGQVGPSISADGSYPEFRLSRTGELIVTELHGKYAEQMYRGKVFWACMTAGVIFPAPAATAANVFTLYNPLGSPVNLNLISFDQVVTIIPGTPLTGLYGLYVNLVPQAAAVTGTALGAIPGLVGSKYVPFGVPLTTTTVPVAPTLMIPYGNKVTGEVVTADPSPGIPPFHLEFDGKVSLSPGAAITPQQTVADTTNATVICAICWEEVPV